MTLAELRRSLPQHGVSLSLTAEGKLRYDAPHGLPPELIEALREHRAALVEALGTAPVPRLPADLAAMVQAAASGQLQHGAALPSGLVTDLGGYVLAWAGAYLTGDHAHALNRLEEARSGWQERA